MFNGLAFAINNKSFFMQQETNEPADENESLVEENQKASEQNEQIREGEILKYDDVVPDHNPQIDTEEISSTDDV